MPESTPRFYGTPIPNQSSTSVSPTIGNPMSKAPSTTSTPKVSKSKAVRRRESRRTEVRQAFDREALRRICQAHESDFVQDFDMEYHEIPNRMGPENWYAFKDNGSDILFVAHLDTVSGDHARACRFVSSEAGLVVFSRALDDRLGAYVGLDLLPKLGLKFDILLTVGEESGMSTAEFFDTTKQYKWIIEFDRGGTDVVMYQYDDADTRDLVREAGATVGHGSFSDISTMDDLGVKAFNWGVGYRDYHSDRSHAFLEDTFEMVGYFLNFHEANKDTRLPHDGFSGYGRGLWGGLGGYSHGGSWRWEDDDFDVEKGERDDEAEYNAWLASQANPEPEPEADPRLIVSDDQAVVNAIIVNEMAATDREL